MYYVLVFIKGEDAQNFTTLRRLTKLSKFTVFLVNLRTIDYEQNMGIKKEYL